MDKFTQLIKVVKGLTPSSDIYNTNPSSDEVNMENYARAAFVLHQQTAGSNTGTATVKLQACADASGTSAEDIAFTYRKIPTGTSDTLGAETAATTSGFTTTANEHAVYICEVDAQALPAGKAFVRMKLTEVVNDPVIGSVLIYLYGSRFAGDTLPTAIA